MDQLGSFKTTSGEKKHILMCLDYITKHVEAASVTDTTSALVVEFINENIHFRHGGSTRIISDQGTAFSSHLMEEKTKEWGTHHVLDGGTSGNVRISREGEHDDNSSSVRIRQHEP